MKQQLTAVLNIYGAFANMTLLCRHPCRPGSQTRGPCSYVINSDSVLSSVSLDNHVFSLVSCVLIFHFFHVFEAEPLDCLLMLFSAPQAVMPAHPLWRQ